MDRNQVTGLILISLMLIVYFQFFAPEPQAPEPQDTEEVVLPSQQTPGSTSQTPSIQPLRDSDSAQNEEQIQAVGPFAAASSGNKELIDIENDEVSLSFSSRGAVLERVQLKKFETYTKEPLVLIDESNSKINLYITGPEGVIDLSNLYYRSDSRIRNDTTQLTFLADLGSGKSIIHTYFIPRTGYRIGYSLALNGLDEYTSADLKFEWVERMKLFEKNLDGSRAKATVNYYEFDGGFDGFSETSNDLEEENIGSTKWIAFKQHFFTSAVIARTQFPSAFVTSQVDENDQSAVKIVSTAIDIPASNMNQGKLLTYYFGPNNYQILKKVAPDFSKNIYLGWTPVNVVNKFIIIPIFNFLENYISNYGIIIIILVLVIKVVLSPLSYKSYLSMAKTKVLKPELDEMKAKFPDDMQKQQQEQMKLYQQVGVNPLSGCIPVLLQMPILFAMFYFFPSSIELRQESFLWADDLSTYDSIIDLPFVIPLYGDHVSLFTLLMTASTILYTWSNNQVTSIQGPMKSISYFMPVVFMFVLNSFPAALSFYYFISNIVTFGQQSIIRKFVDEEKIKVILDENRLKNKSKTKSKFQLKLEEAMKASQESKKKKSAGKK